MNKTDLTYGGLSSGLSDGTDPHLYLFTPGGTVRKVPLDRKQLLRIIKAAAGALEALDR